MKKFRKNSKGFTLIELMIVIAIIGILAAIALPQFAGYRKSAHCGSLKSDVRNAAAAAYAINSVEGDWASIAGAVFDSSTPMQSNGKTYLTPAGNNVITFSGDFGGGAGTITGTNDTDCGETIVWDESIGSLQ